MIKCEVNVCAVITRNASVMSMDGKEFFVFGIKIPVKDRKGDVKDLEISVSNDGGKGKAAMFTTGRRVAIKGVLSLRKKGDKLFWNLRSEGDVELTKTTAEDNIEGKMEFVGKVGKNGVSMKSDKNGKNYKTFSAFSTDKDGDKADFTWVSFMYFEPKEDESFLAANKYVHIKGTLQLGVYKDEVSLQCLVNEVSEYVFPEK